VLTNFLNVYTPKLIRDGINLLTQANEQYYSPIEKAKEMSSSEGGEINLSEIFENGSIDTPPTIAQLQTPLNIEIGDSVDVSNMGDLGKLLISLAVLLAILYIVIYFLKGVFLFFTRQTIIVMSRLIEYDMKKEIFDQYQMLNLSFYKRNNTGDLMNRISEDVSKVRMYLGPAVMYTLNLVVLIILVIYEMSAINVELTIYSLLPLPFMSVGVYYVSSMINRRSERVQRQQSKLSTMVQESISGIRVLKAFHRENYSKKSFQEESESYKTRALDLVKIDALFIPIIVLLVGLSTILTIYIGGTKVINGELDLGAIFSFVFYVNMLTWPFASVGWVTSLVQKAEASQERINEFMDVEPEIKNPSSVDFKFEGKMEFRNVSFIYPDSGIEALKNVSFTLEKGETLAVIGRTGSGKSTLANLLVRHYDSTSGSILLDDKKIDSLNLYQLRESIGYVPQEVFLFSDTIKNNIAFGVQDSSLEQIQAAAKIADVHDNIVEFPKSYETLLGERGINLSGGQKQRISIARAIIKQPEMLIFDDCLSAVDTETEEHILSHLKEIMKDKTSVIISHRVSSIKHADKILLLDQGKIIESGSHEELLSTEGSYYGLYNKQLLEEQE